MRHYSVLDKIIMQIDAAVHTVLAEQSASRPNPAQSVAECALSATDQRKSQGYMRVNHTGEVCAQALYHGQMVFTEDATTHTLLQQAASEETDHLAWTHQRLKELDTHRSYLNFFWYMHSFCLGMLASKCGDVWSLGFVEETERQVAAHLTGHLSALSTQDLRSRAIISAMREDEQRHGASAKAAGAADLPRPVKTLMAWHAFVMKQLAYYI